MNKVLLDTDVFSEIQKGLNKLVAARSETYLTRYGRHTISVITLFENISGYRRLQREDKIRGLVSGLTSLELLTLDKESSELAGRILGDLEQAGRPIGFADPVIAAIALRNGLALATGNVSHFQHINDLGYPLRIENWRE